jgi:hypothetical protein
MILHDVIFNTTSWISIWSCAFLMENICKFHSVVDFHDYLHTLKTV